MSQNLIPLDGGQERIVTSTATTGLLYLSKQYLEAKGLYSRPTEWTGGRRPIYGRLPSASETYKLEFGLEEDTAYVYIPPGQSTVGVGSLQVTTSGENKFLVIQSGEIVWKYGKLPADPVIIDLQLMDMVSTKYLLAYQMYYDDAPYVAQYEVDSFSLSGYDLNVSSPTDSYIGWRYTSNYAFSALDNQYWKNFDEFFPAYTSPAELAWQAPYAHAYSKVLLRCPTNTVVTGSATLYYMTCQTTLNEGSYCSSPTWNAQVTTEVKSDSDGFYFEFVLPEPSYQRGWKVTWSDSKVAINTVLVSGVLSLLKRPSGAFTSYQLVAYPENSVPDSIVNTAGEPVPLVLCELAYVDINQFYEVERVQDLRQTVYTDYTPVADWLTKPWDDNLMSVYDQVDNYPRLWMNPVEAMKQEYIDLEKVSVKVES